MVVEVMQNRFSISPDILAGLPFLFRFTIDLVDLSYTHSKNF